MVAVMSGLRSGCSGTSTKQKKRRDGRNEGDSVRNGSRKKQQWRRTMCVSIIYFLAFYC